MSTNANRPGSSASSQNNFDGVNNSNAMGSQTYLHGKKAGQQKNGNKESYFTRFVNALWATRQTRDTKNDSELLIKTTLKELIIYLVFVAVICIITFGMTSSINYYFTNVMMSLFLTQNTVVDETGAPTAGVNFNGMGSMDDFWDVYKGPILDGLYMNEWYNGNASEPGYIYYENKLLGVPRLRQMRVKKGSCKVHPLFKTSIADCYDSYSYFSEDQTPFGPYLTTQSNMVDTAFYYQDSGKVQGAIVSGQVSVYGGGGYVKNLGANKTESQAIVQNLKENMWLDRGTRAVFLDFTIYNANINLFCTIRLITEFPPTGGVLPSSSFRTVKLIRYLTPMDYFVLACEIIFILFLVYYSIEEALEIKIHKLKYFTEVWNVLDIVTLLIAYICVIFNIYRVVRVNQLLDSLLTNGTQYPEFDSLAYWQSLFNNAIALTAFLCWIRIFKYISFNKTMTQLSSTLGRCAKDVLGFAVMFYIVFFAYAQLGYLLFGSMVPDYSTFTNTLFTLFRIILGDFDFTTLESQSRVLGPIYFLSYVFFVFFVLLNMFLAIINDTYSDVKSDISEQKSDIELGEYFKRGYDKILTKMNLKKDKIVDIQKALAMADANKDNNLNFDEWRAELRNRGYADAEIEAYFSQYDKDGDRNLSLEEQERMKKDLNDQSDQLDKEMKNASDNSKKDVTEYTEEELEMEERARKANSVSMQEFRILNVRVDTMETSIGNIVNKIDTVLSKLESIERAKLKRREAMAKILDKLNDANSIQDAGKRAQIQKMVKDELEKWDLPLSTTPSAAGYTSRAASPPSFNSSTTNLNLEKKSAWLQQ